MSETIILPWPNKALSPNSRVDRRSAAGTRKAYRQAGAWAAKAAGWGRLDWPSVHLAITFCPPDNRRRDIDNMLASIKSGIDGVSDAIGVDDHVFEYSLRRGDACKGGEVWINIQRPSVASVPFRGQVS